MVQNIYLIRHGQTDWNKARRFQGSKDIPLNDEGRSQALKLQRSMKDVPLDFIVASPLKRAYETAEILNQAYNLPINVDEGLQEINFGRWEGLDFQTIQKEYPAEAELWLKDPGRLVIPQGEGFEEFKERVWQSFLYWTNREEYKNMAVVAHGGTCAAIICSVLNKPVACMWDYLQGNTSLNRIIRCQGHYELAEYNGQDHLA